MIIGGDKYLFCPYCEISTLWNSNIVNSKCSFCNKFKLITINCKHEFSNEIIERKRGKVSGPTAQVGVQKSGICGTSVNHGSFCINCNAWKGQYGLEPTPSDYVSHSLLWAKEAWRVLRNDGVLFLNIADSYGTTSGSMGKGKWNDPKWSNEQNKSMPEKPILNMHKCQLLIPHRVAIALVDSGWTLRNTIIWYKTNAMPESVTDRFSKKYEYIFMFTKQAKYYFDLDAVREKCSPLNRWGGNKLIAKGQSEWDKGTGQITYMDRDMQPNNGMKNPGDVWIIPTVPSSEKHYAMWPERPVERMVKCSTKAGDIVLDPFCGSGSTLKVAEQLNRKGIGIDLGYHEISKRRTSKIQKEMFV